MVNRDDDVERVINDLKFVKATIAKSGGIIRHLALSRVMRMVYLMMGLAVYKAVGVLASARKVRSAYTLFRLAAEIYSVQTILILVPFFVAGAGVVSFLATRGLSVYIVSVLAILFGLMFNTFGLGFIVTYVAGLMMARGEGDEGEPYRRG